MKADVIAGLFFASIGIFFVFIGYSTYASFGTLRVLLYSPVLVFLGLAMAIFPGTKYTCKDLREGKVIMDWNYILKKTTTKAKIIWLIAVIIGAILSTAYREELASLFI